MLTDPLLVCHVNSGLLQPWNIPAAVPLRVRRQLLVTQEVAGLVNMDPWPREPEDRSDRDARERRRSLHAVALKFIAGNLMAPREEIERLSADKDDCFDRLLEIRSGPPRPQSRLFCYVFSPGVFIGVKFALRSELGEMGDPRWAAAARAAKDVWDGLFPGRAPIAIKRQLDFSTLGELCNG